MIIDNTWMAFSCYVDDTCSWLTITPAILFLVGLCFVPPSPRYLAITGKPHMAKKLLLVHRYIPATVQADVDTWLSSKDVFSISRLLNMKYVKMYGPVLGLSLLELHMGPVLILFYLQEICFYIYQSWDFGCAMAGIIGLSFFVGSCAAYKLHNWVAQKAIAQDTRNYKKLLFWSLSLMAISLFAISGDIHYSKTSGQLTSRYAPPEVLHSFYGDGKKMGLSVGLLCIFMVIYAVGVRQPVAVLEERFIGQRTTGTGTLMYKAINTTAHWLVVPLLIHLFLLHWRHIGLGWILVFFALVCLLTITYVAVFIPDNVPTDDGDDEGSNPETTESQENPGYEEENEVVV